MANDIIKVEGLIAKKQVAALSSKFNNIYNLSDDEAQSTKVLGKNLRAYYFKEMGEHPTGHYLKDLDKPVLIMQGEKDVQSTVERDFEVYKNLLDGKPNATFKLYPNLNHLFIPSIYGEILKVQKEYKVAQNIDRQVINDISEWILSV